MPIQDFPRCAGYLKASNYRLDDPAMHSKAWAVCMSEAFTDEELVADGSVNFETMSGDAILAEFERLLKVRAPAARHVRRHASGRFDNLESLKAFIGSRGVKVSALASDEDYWTVARILWPQVVSRDDAGPLSLLHHKIRCLSKRERQSARANLVNVPVEWRGVAA